MSTFSDIWLGKQKPNHKRKDNLDWQREENVWLSLSDSDSPFLKQYKSNGYQLILIGQLYERVDNEELLARLLAYIKGEPFKDPAGHYIIFLQEQHNTYVFTNRLGTMHGYWSDKNRSISTYYTALVKTTEDKELDWYGLSGFFAMGYFPNDSTYIKSIKVFEPASYYHFDSECNLLNKKRYWNWTYNPQEQPIEQWFEKLHHILQSSLLEATNNYKVALPISGGLDSRMLAGELCNTDNVKAFSYGYTTNSPETKIAKQIAKVSGFDSHSYVMPDYLFDELDDVVDAVELFQYVDGTRQASAKEWLQKNADVVVGGHWGDVWMNNMKVVEKADLNEAFNKKIIKRGSKWLLQNICNNQVVDTEDYLQNYFSSYVSKYSHIEDTDFVMKIYKTDEWSHRWTTASVRMYQSGAFPVLPFYDNRVVDLFSEIPTNALKNREFQIAYIKHYYPELAKIKWQEYDANLYNYKKFNNRNIAYRAVSKIKRVVQNETPIQRNWEVFYLHDKGRKNLEEHLLDNELLGEYVAEEKIKILLDELYTSPTGANGYTVSMLLTFSLFLKGFFDS